MKILSEPAINRLDSDDEIIRIVQKWYEYEDKFEKVKEISVEANDRCDLNKVKQDHYFKVIVNVDNRKDEFLIKGSLINISYLKDSTITNTIKCAIRLNNFLPPIIKENINNHNNKPINEKIVKAVYDMWAKVYKYDEIIYTKDIK